MVNLPGKRMAEHAAELGFSIAYNDEYAIKVA